MFWLPEHGALVPGDRILGAPDGGLMLCPESWLYWVGVNRDELRVLLRPLLDLPIERVLVSHGDLLRGAADGKEHQVERQCIADHLGLPRPRVDQIHEDTPAAVVADRTRSIAGGRD